MLNVNIDFEIKYSCDYNLEGLVILLVEKNASLISEIISFVM